ncbi:hypothetical protein BKA69DRAFT_499505 [Paraphysoderma sedebokerense]|nr:hypothetical protein BKA69DRAFT_499505 [Paraphysoderma sedebokerense]
MLQTSTNPISPVGYLSNAHKGSLDRFYGLPQRTVSAPDLHKATTARDRKNRRSTFDNSVKPTIPLKIPKAPIKNMKLIDRKSPNYALKQNVTSGMKYMLTQTSEEKQLDSSSVIFNPFGQVIRHKRRHKSKGTFEFKQYSPAVFHRIRKQFGVSDNQLARWIDTTLYELPSPGKSGDLFLFSENCIIKTIHATEKRQLLKMLPDYSTHYQDNPDSLLIRYYGLYRVKSSKRKIYVVAMNNFLPQNGNLSAIFDLKGSTVGREVPSEIQNDPTVVCKDLNWSAMKRRLHLDPERKNVFLSQMQKDLEFLAKQKVMDYSLLVGISRNIPDECNKNSNTSSTEGLFYRENGGFRSSSTLHSGPEEIYFLGIIDILTKYTLSKKVETFWKGFQYDKKFISSVNPKFYSKRFYNFISGAVATE